MERLGLVCLGGAFGTGVRYLVGLWAVQRFGTALPYGTLIVNIAGCFLMGAVMQTALTLTSFPESLRLALTAGVMGGLTTYSSFAFETTRFALEGARRDALLNFTITTVACFVALAIGLALPRLLLRSP